MSHQHGERTTFFYNSDLSGDVTIILDDGQEMKVPGEDLLGFFAEFLRDRRNDAIQAMTVGELLS